MSLGPVGCRALDTKKVKKSKAKLAQNLTLSDKFEPRKTKLRVRSRTFFFSRFFTSDYSVQNTDSGVGKNDMGYEI